MLTDSRLSPSALVSSETLGPGHNPGAPGTKPSKNDFSENFRHLCRMRLRVKTLVELQKMEEVVVLTYFSLRTVFFICFLLGQGDNGQIPPHSSAEPTGPLSISASSWGAYGRRLLTPAGRVPQTRARTGMGSGSDLPHRRVAPVQSVHQLRRDPMSAVGKERAS